MSKSVSPQMVLTVVPSAGCLNLCAVFREFVNAAKKLCVPKGSLNRVFIFSVGGCGGPYAAFRMRAFGSLGRFCFSMRRVGGQLHEAAQTEAARRFVEQTEKLRQLADQVAEQNKKSPSSVNRGSCVK